MCLHNCVQESRTPSHSVNMPQHSIFIFSSKTGHWFEKILQHAPIHQMGKNIVIAQPDSPTVPIFVKFLHMKNSSSKTVDYNTLWNQKGFWMHLAQVSVQCCQQLINILHLSSKGLEMSQRTSKVVNGCELPSRSFISDSYMGLPDNHIRESSEKTPQNKTHLSSELFCIHWNWIHVSPPLATREKKGPACLLYLPCFVHVLDNGGTVAKFWSSFWKSTFSSFPINSIM